MYLVGRMQFLNVKRGGISELVGITMCLLLLLLLFTCTQVIYKLPETNHICMVHKVLDILWLQFMARAIFPVINVFYCYIGTSQVCAHWPVWFSQVP